MNPTVIDFQKLKTEQEREKLRAACETFGFFALSNHGIVERAKFFQEMALFFDQGQAEKTAVERTEENPFGYYDKELTKNTLDWKEVFDISLTSETLWPEKPVFKGAMTRWHEACHQVAIKLFDAVMQSIDLAMPTQTFEPEHTSFLRLNYYRPCPEAETAEQPPFGVSHHTDAGILTLLQQDDIEGLQFKVEETWLTAPADPTVLLVNLGDMLQVWTNDQFKAPLHRVLTNSTAPRYSAPYFLNPAYQCDCSPLKTASPNYRSINWGEYRYGRTSGDYADIGEEIQISQFRI